MIVLVVRLRGILVLLFLLGLVAAMAMQSHHARAETPEAARTATWYANHPAVMRRMHAACVDDPGHGHHAPDCINARAGEWVEAERRARYAVAHPAPPVLSPFDQLPMMMARRR